MIKRFLTCVLLANASIVLALPRIVAARAKNPQPSLEQLTATLLRGAGARGEDLVSVAAERAERLGRLIETDPARVLRLAVSPAFRATLPPKVRDFVEERVEMEGTLQVLIEDRHDGSRMLISLDSDSGEHFALFFASEPPQLLSGARVRVKGLRVGQTIAVESGARHVQSVSKATTESAQATAVLPNTFGVQTMLSSS